MIILNYFCFISAVFASADKYGNILSEDIPEEKQSVGVIGLRNRGTDCFINSSIQILLASVGFKYLNVLPEDIPLGSIDAENIMKLGTRNAVQTLFDLAVNRRYGLKYSQRMEEAMDVFVPTVLSDSPRNSRLQSLMNQYNDGNQHDLSEFIIALIDRLPKAFSDLFAIHYSSIKKYRNGQSELDCFLFDNFFIQVQANHSRSSEGKSLIDELNNEALDSEDNEEHRASRFRLISAQSHPEIILIKINRTILEDDAIENLRSHAESPRSSESSESGSSSRSPVKSISNQTTALEASSKKSTTSFLIPRDFMINTLGVDKLCDLRDEELKNVHIPERRFYESKNDPKHQEDVEVERVLANSFPRFNGLYEELHYQLCAIGMHIGDGTTSGHYVAATKNPFSESDEWHLISDDHVKNIKDIKSFINHPETQSQVTVLAYRFVDKTKTF